MISIAFELHKLLSGNNGEQIGWITSTDAIFGVLLTPRNRCVGERSQTQVAGRRLEMIKAVGWGGVGWGCRGGLKVET